MDIASEDKFKNKRTEIELSISLLNPKYGKHKGISNILAHKIPINVPQNIPILISIIRGRTIFIYRNNIGITNIGINKYIKFMTMYKNIIL